MDPRAVLEPVGPLPPRVYWIRRGFLLAVLVVLVAVIAVSCSGSSPRRTAQTGKPVVTPSSTPSATPTSPTATPSPTGSSGVPHCGRADITVTASTDAASYAPGVIPQLQVAIRNSSGHACYLTESPSRRSWTIVSGTDTVWTTVGCQRSTAAIRTTLSPDETVRHTLAWNRHRSGPNCTTTSRDAPAGTYQVYVVVSGVRSDKAVFQLSK